MKGTSSPESISTRLKRIAQLAKEAPNMVLTTVAHNIDVEFLREAYRLTRKNGAVGVDGQTGAEYGENLEQNLQSLLDRFKSGRYQAPPVRRVYIPKAGKRNAVRPIGIPAFEDKVLQRAVTMVLEAIYEQDFLNCSYGFRPGKSPHKALDALWNSLMRMGGGWIVEVDIADFFGSVKFQDLRGFLDQRVRDGTVRKTIDKWLKAGVMEDGRITILEAGTPQGGVASPVLSNIYLHEVIDKWFARDVQPRLQGQSFMVRFADDIVCAFASEQDARRVMEVLPKRFGKYGLTLHATKTRLIRFDRPPKSGTPSEEAGTFEFLGFLHYWGRSRRGSWILKRKTGATRLKRAAKAVNDWCRSHRHEPIAEQHRMLTLKIRGHYNYYGVTGNIRALGNFLYLARCAWQKWLNRRSEKRTMNWGIFEQLETKYSLPPPRIYHSSSSA